MLILYNFFVVKIMFSVVLALYNLLPSKPALCLIESLSGKEFNENLCMNLTIMRI